MTNDYQVYWAPGCTSCLRTKEFLSQHGIAFESINIVEHPEALDDLARAIDAFEAALTEVERPPIDEAEVLEYFDAALALHAAVKSLRARAGCAVGGTLRPLDIVRTESLNTLDVHTRDRVLARSYCLLLSMAPMVPATCVP